MMKVYVTQHDTDWRRQYEIESEELITAIGSKTLSLHHVGSTSIPGIFAKPIIDILGEVNQLEEIDLRTDTMTNLGYEVMGEFGIPERRYFRKEDESGTRKYHLHVFETGSSGVVRHLAFRDYLRNHRELASQYSELKIVLAEKYPESIADYMAGKDAFIKNVESKAMKIRGAA